MAGNLICSGIEVEWVNESVLKGKGRGNRRSNDSKGNREWNAVDSRNFRGGRRARTFLEFRRHASESTFPWKRRGRKGKNPVAEGRRTWTKMLVARNITNWQSRHVDIALVILGTRDKPIRLIYHLVHQAVLASHSSFARDPVIRHHSFKLNSTLDRVLSKLGFLCTQSLKIINSKWKWNKNRGR